jgi:uncharacterized phage protein gp47/JayE
MSSFVVQRASQLRDTILDLQSAAYAEFGEVLDTSDESDAFRQASAFALCLEVVHARLLVTEAAIFPDTALTEDLVHHAGNFGLERKPATAARLVCRASNGGAGVATYPLAGETLNHSNGTKYLPVDASGAPLASLTTDVLGGVQFFVDAQSVGTSTNLSPGYDLVWSAAPAGLLATGEVLAVARSGADAESDVDLAARLLAYLRSRPAAGNTADWQSWALEVAGIKQAFVYPATNPAVPTTNHTPGAVTLVVLTDRAVSNGIASSGDVANVGAYIEGTQDANGNALAGDERSRQKRFCSLDGNDVVIIAAGPTPQDVEMNVTVKGEPIGAWGPLAVAAAPASTTTIVQVPSTAGITAGHWIAVENGAVLGGWETRKIVSFTATSITVAPALLAAPAPFAAVRRAWSGWEAARNAVLDVFRGLGPGDFSADMGGPTRFPETTEVGPDKLYVSSLAAAVIGFVRGSGTSTGVSGVVDAAVVVPSASVQENPFELLVPQWITFVPSN